MSRIGKKPIIVESGVKVSLLGDSLHIEGVKGQIDLKIPGMIKVIISDNKVEVQNKDQLQNNMHGLTRTLIQNAILGVTKQWTKTLELVGVGFRAQTDGKQLTLNLGFAHPVILNATDDITFRVIENKIEVIGADRYKVGEMAAKIRDIKKPEPYKGKGIRYLGEFIRKKLGKAAKAVGAVGAK